MIDVPIVRLVSDPGGQAERVGSDTPDVGAEDPVDPSDVLCVLNDSMPLANAIVESLLIGAQDGHLVGSGSGVHEMRVVMEELPDPRVNKTGGRGDLCRLEIA